MTNSGGTISANGQTLQVTNSTINGGTVSLTGAGLLQLSNSTIQSGTLNNSATGNDRGPELYQRHVGGNGQQPGGRADQDR